MDSEGKHWGSVMSVTNEARLLSIRIGLPRTTVLGKRVMVEFGQRAVERETARDCRAALTDAASGEHITTLWWEPEPGKIVDVCDIACGQAVNLRTFVWQIPAGQEFNQADEYYAYQPTPGPILEPKLDRAPRFTESMNFLIVISYQYGSKQLRVPASGKKRHDGTLHIQQGGSGMG